MTPRTQDLTSWRGYGRCWHRESVGISLGGEAPECTVWAARLPAPRNAFAVKGLPSEDGGRLARSAGTEGFTVIAHRSYTGREAVIASTSGREATDSVMRQYII